MRPTIMRLLNASAVNQVLGRIKSEAPIYWESLKTSQKESFSRRLNSINAWYTKFLGLDEVKLYQDRVFTLQEKLLQAQDKRREIGRALAEIRKKSNQLQDEVHKVKRQEDIEKFLNLMKEETEVLRLEHETARTFQECDQAERELFTAFTNAVRDSHEKQRAQLEYTKYFGIILSIAGSFLAFCYTTFRKDDLKRFIEDSVAKNSVGMDIADNNNDNILDLVKTETVKLREIISFNQNEVLYRIQIDNEARNKELLYFAGLSFLLLIFLKAVSN